MRTQAFGKTPLTSYRCFQTQDVDEAREIVGRHFCSHRLEPMSASDPFDACQNRVCGDRLSLNYIRYGSDVVIEPGELSEFFLIQIPINGTADIRNGRRTVFSSPKTGTILNPDRYTSMRWHTGCEQLLLQVERSYMREVAVKMTGLPVGEVRFDPEFNLETVRGNAWKRALLGAVTASENHAAFGTRESPLQRHLAEGLLLSLFEMQSSTVASLLEGAGGGTQPAIVRRAVSLINDCFMEDLSLLDISQFAGTTPRNLQLLFQRQFDCSPIRYLHTVRLNFARHLLLTEGQNCSVAEIADRSGHRHWGRFSSAYKDRFGETPRETARQRLV